MTEYTELRDLDDEVFRCKVLWNHDWDDNPTPQYIDGQIARLAYRIVALRCTRCKRERYTYLNSRGERIAPHYYKNPVDYPKTHKFGADELWREAIKRSVFAFDYKAIPMERSNGRKSTSNRLPRSSAKR